MFSCGWLAFGQSVVQLPLGNAEVRRGPHGAAIAEQDRLRRLVTDAQTEGRFVRELTVALHRDQFVRSGAARIFDVRVKFVQRFAADAARAAMFEQENRSLAGFRDGGRPARRGPTVCAQAA